MSRPVHFAMALLLSSLAVSGTVSCGGSSNDPDDDGGVDLGPLEDADVDAEVDAGPVDTGCNNHMELCERRYDEVAYATAHNAHANTADGFSPPNHTNGLTQQLRDGIRGFMLDTYYDDRFNNQPTLCHGACVFGRRLLTDGLTELNDFLDRNPGAVITIIFESYISAEDTRGSFEASGLLDRVYAHTAGEPWPTLGELVENDTRVVVFTDEGGGTYDWYMDVRERAWGTHCSDETPEAFSCAPNRGDTDNALFIFNHFLTAPFASMELAEMVNHNPSFLTRVETCQTESDDFANFITVDFYEIGDVLAVTDTLNGF